MNKYLLNVLGLGFGLMTLVSCQTKEAPAQIDPLAEANAERQELANEVREARKTFVDKRSAYTEQAEKTVDNLELRIAQLRTKDFGEDQDRTKSARAAAEELGVRLNDAKMSLAQLGGAEVSEWGMVQESFEQEVSQLNALYDATAARFNIAH